MQLDSWTPRFGKAASAFERGPKERPLRVLLDHDSLGSCEALDMLKDFGSSEEIRDEIEVISPDRRDGVAHVKIGRPDIANDIIPLKVTYPNTRSSRTAIHSYRALMNVVAHEGGSSGVRRALIMGNVAEQLGVDAFATCDPYLLGEGVRWVRTANPMTPEEAAALVGLHRRLRGD